MAPLPCGTPSGLVPPPGYASPTTRPEFPVRRLPISTTSNTSGGYLITQQSSSPFGTDSQFFVPHSGAPVPNPSEARIPEHDVCVFPGQQQPNPHEGLYPSVSSSYQAHGQESLGAPHGTGYDVISRPEAQTNFPEADGKGVWVRNQLPPQTQLSTELNRETTPFSRTLLEQQSRSMEAGQMSNNVHTPSYENQLDYSVKYSEQCDIDQKDSFQSQREEIAVLYISYAKSEDPEIGDAGQELTGNVTDAEQQCKRDSDDSSAPAHEIERQQTDLTETDRSQHDVFKRPYLPFHNDNNNNIRCYQPNRETQNIHRRSAAFSDPSNHDSRNSTATNSETQDYQQGENTEMNDSNFYTEMQKDIWGSTSHFPVLLDGMNYNNSASESASDVPVDLSSDTGTDSSPVDLSFKTSDDEDVEMDSISAATEDNMTQQDMNSVAQQGLPLTNWNNRDGHHSVKSPNYTQPNDRHEWKNPPLQVPNMRHDGFLLKPDIRHQYTDEDKTSNYFIEPTAKNPSEKRYGTLDLTEDKNTECVQPSSAPSNSPKSSAMQPLALPVRRRLPKTFRFQGPLLHTLRQNSPRAPSPSRTSLRIPSANTPPNTPISAWEYANSPGAPGTPGQSTRCSTPTLSGSLAYTPPTTPTDTVESTSNEAPFTVVQPSATVNLSGALIHVTLPTTGQDNVKSSPGKLAGLLTYLPPEIYGELRDHKSGQKVKAIQTVKQSPQTKRLQHNDISRLLPIIKISQAYIQRMHATKTGDSRRHAGFKIIYELFTVRSIRLVNNDNLASQNEGVATTKETKDLSAHEKVAQKSPRLRKLLSEKETKEFREELLIVGYKLPNSNSQQVNTLAIQNSKPFLVKVLPRLSKKELLLAKQRILLNRYKQKQKEKQQQRNQQQEQEQLLRQQAVKTLKQYKPFRKVRLPTTGQPNPTTVRRKESSNVAHEDDVSGERAGLARETDSERQRDSTESFGQGIRETPRQHHLKRANSVLNLSVQENVATESCGETPAKRCKSENEEKTKGMDELKEAKSEQETIKQEDAGSDQCGILDFQKIPETTIDKKVEDVKTNTCKLKEKSDKNKDDLKSAKNSINAGGKNTETPRTLEKQTMIYQKHKKVGDLDRVIHKLKRGGAASAGK